MVDKELLEELLLQAGITPEKLQVEARERMIALNEKLETQLKAQKMTQEALNKVCDL